MSKKVRLEASTRVHLLDLPQELVFCILQWLDWQNHLTISILSRSINKLCQNPQSRCPYLTLPKAFTGPNILSQRQKYVAYVERLIKEFSNRPTLFLSKQHQSLKIYGSQVLKPQILTNLPDSLGTFIFSSNNDVDCFMFEHNLQSLVQDFLARCRRLKKLVLNDEFEIMIKNDSSSKCAFPSECLQHSSRSLEVIVISLRYLHMNVSSFSAFRQLTQLHLFFAKATMNMESSLKDHLLSLPNLTDLSVKTSRITRLNLAKCIVSPPIAIISPLTNLTLAGQIHVGHSRFFLDQFPGLKQLNSPRQEVNFGSNLGNNGGFDCPDSLLPKLERLTLSDLAVCSVFIVQQLPKMCALRELELTPSVVARSELQQEILFTLGGLPNLEELVMQGAFQARIWPLKTLVFNALKRLDLQYSRFHLSCARPFLAWLDRQPKLEKVWMFNAFEYEKEVQAMIKSSSAPFLLRVCDFMTH